ncbi:MAG: cytochrome c biogenesis protein CcsA [Desulfomonilia bacterium]
MIGTLVLIAYTITGLASIFALLIRTGAWIMISRFLFSVCGALHLVFILSLARSMHTIPVFSPALGVNMMIFLASIVFLALAWKKKTASLAAFFLPPATFAIALALPPILQHPDIFVKSYQYWYPLHTLSVIGGEALFVVASITSVVYLIHEKIIRKGSIHSRGSGLPPLSILDSILYMCLSAGFIAITVGMILGGLWASSLDLSFGSIAPKVIAGALLWFIFAFSLHQRFAIGWKGRRTAIITLIGFCVMILLFLGMNLVFPHAHGIGLL